MGLFNWLTRKGGNISSSTATPTTAHGSHSIDPATVMHSHGGISPINPGNFGTIRTLPLVPSPRYFSKEESDQLRQMAKQKRKDAIATRQVYKALASVEESDALVHVSHRAYEGVSAASELQKKRADAQLARQLHSQRSSYSRLHYGLELAGQQAQLRIQAAQEQMDQQFAQMAAKLQGGGDEE
jgi:hypothetical protein